MHTYYLITSPSTARFPQHFTDIDLFVEPYYEPAIDHGCYGVVIYDQPLSPAEVAGSGLVSEPRD